MTNKPRVLKHSIFGVLALAVAALDLRIGTKHMITAGIIALTASLYSFAKATNLRKIPRDKENRP
ncbi:MAG: hypothetical protein U5O16_39040 [Rhodococcus sp. (in: high G+C Gram-positive bacteria)]|uniref:hypothetical protein n=1 Tax=Rhodococcus sp. TaxID=1831 RepID=UPI002AD93989|nr:hypothetical protein [Rhodococcus sp. (in: high G+C Gram-positive bacteria)]